MPMLGGYQNQMTTLQQQLEEMRARSTALTEAGTQPMQPPEFNFSVEKIYGHPELMDLAVQRTMKAMQNAEDPRNPLELLEAEADKIIAEGKQAPPQDTSFGIGDALASPFMALHNLVGKPLQRLAGNPERMATDYWSEHGGQNVYRMLHATQPELAQKVAEVMGLDYDDSPATGSRGNTKAPPSTLPGMNELIDSVLTSHKDDAANKWRQASHMMRAGNAAAVQDLEMQKLQNNVVGSLIAVMEGGAHVGQMATAEEAQTKIGNSTINANTASTLHSMVQMEALAQENNREAGAAVTKQFTDQEGAEQAGLKTIRDRFTTKVHPAAEIAKITKDARIPVGKTNFGNVGKGGGSTAGTLPDFPKSPSEVQLDQSNIQKGDPDAEAARNAANAIQGLAGYRALDRDQAKILAQEREIEGEYHDSRAEPWWMDMPVFHNGDDWDLGIMPKGLREQRLARLGRVERAIAAEKEPHPDDVKGVPESFLTMLQSMGAQGLAENLMDSDFASLFMGRARMEKNNLTPSSHGMLRGSTAQTDAISNVMAESGDQRASAQMLFLENLKRQQFERAEADKQRALGYANNVDPMVAQLLAEALGMSPEQAGTATGQPTASATPVPNPVDRFASEVPAGFYDQGGGGGEGIDPNEEEIQAMVDAVMAQDPEMDREDMMAWLHNNYGAKAKVLIEALQEPAG